MGRVADKVIVVTGGAKGLGEADVRLLAKEGARVILADVDEPNGRRVAAEIGADFARLDVTREAEWEDLIGRVVAQHGRLDGLVNNAGVVEVGPIDTATEAEWRRTMAVSADGTFFGCKHAVRAMRRTGGGSIVNMASIASLRGQWRFTAYCAAKGAVEALTRAVAVYSADNKLGVRCNSIHPSGFDTPMVRDVQVKLAGGAAPGRPVVELGQPIDIAQAVLFLLSDESRYVNGVALSVDNGAAVA